jgi:N-methylhydantoinase B
MGARCGADGMEAIHVHLTNTSNLPAEALENEYSLLVDEYALVPDSGGAGRHRGGLGIARQIRAMRDGVVFSVRSDGHVLGAPGLAGGRPGGTARLLRNFGTDRQEELSSKTASIELATGETIRIETPGGGGLGDPAERDQAALAADLRGGKLSPDRARVDYPNLPGQNDVVR